MARILVVEDDEFLARQLVDWLRHEEHMVELVFDAFAATRALTQTRFDLLILDWELPGGKSGLEICKDYRETGGKAGIIMLTGRTAPIDRSAGLDSGADDYLTKPFHLRELSSRIKAVLRRTTPSSSMTSKLIPIGLCPECNAIFDARVEVCVEHGLPLSKDLVDAGSGTFGDKYKVASVIGRGGMSTVFKAYDNAGKAYAVKVLEPVFIQDYTQLRRFQQEAEILSRLSHPNIVGVYGFAAEEARPYIVMDYIEGRPLSRALDCHEEFPLFRCMKIFKQTCEGMAHAHAHGVIHRDLKPGNILLDATSGKETVQIVDFGVAKYFGEGVEETTAEQRLTRTGQVFGTSMYMSPEQAMGREPDPRSDIYSLGCIMYELITGCPPFTGKTALEVLHKQINVNAASMDTIAGKESLPRSLVRIVQRTLEKSPDCRPNTMLDLLRSLDSIVVY